MSERELTKELIACILSDSILGDTVEDIAKKYLISVETVNKILNGEEQ